MYQSSSIRKWIRQPWHPPVTVPGGGRGNSGGNSIPSALPAAQGYMAPTGSSSGGVGARSSSSQCSGSSRQRLSGVVWTPSSSSWSVGSSREMLPKIGASQTSGQGVRQPSSGPTARGNPSTGPGPNGRPGLHALSNEARGLGASGRTRKIGGIDLPPQTGRVRTWPCSNLEVYLPRVPGKSHQ